MLILADESCDFSVVIGLRSAGHDVLAITEIMSGAEDEQVITLASQQRRLLLTEDKDFGQLVFAAARQSSGVVLIRYTANARSTVVADVVRLLAEHGQTLYGSFTVLQPGRARITSARS